MNSEDVGDLFFPFFFWLSRIVFFGRRPFFFFLREKAVGVSHNLLYFAGKCFMLKQMEVCFWENGEMN